MRLGILGSTRGTHLQTIVDAIAAKRITSSIVTVISNKADAYILTRAQQYNIPAHFVDSTHLTREEYDEKLHVLLKHARVDFVVLIGFMRILSDKFVTAWMHRMINVHPSLLPHFSGKMDLEVHRAVLAAGVSETGCTVHYVTLDVDAGPILLQKKCAVFENDTPQILKQRVQALEGDALIEAIAELESQS